MPDGLRKPAEAMASTEFAKKLGVVVKNDSESESSKNESLKRTSVLGTLAVMRVMKTESKRELCKVPEVTPKWASRP